jgi:phosphoenolpyruvate synthase/pyruvate phosphate dikinase
MDQHEKFVKDAHDCLVEASGKFKDALTKQVREMEKYIDWSEVQKEATAAAANSARMRLRDVSMGVPKELEPTNQGWKNRKIWAETVLATLDKDHESARKGWSEERIVLQEKIKCREEKIEKLKAERDKYKDQVSAHAVRSFRRDQEQVEEKAKAAKLAKEHEELRRIAEHNEDVGNRARKTLEEEIEATFKGTGIKTAIPIGTMIETPRAAITADRLGVYADFFSFGTNDLTQLTWAFSRDDVESTFLPRYLDLELLPFNPFESLDEAGVGILLRTAVDLARKLRNDFKLGVCGEHGGDPRSIHFFNSLGLDYVSCSPFRVPIARLESGRASAIAAKTSSPTGLKGL